VRPNHLGDVYLDHAEFDPLYDILEETGLVLGVHEALGVRGPTIGRDRFETFAARHACSHPLEQMAAAAALLLGGSASATRPCGSRSWSRGPAGSPIGLARLDEHREWMETTECSTLSLAPSEYFARQCVISSDPEDTLAGFVIDRVGADHVMWASDFPHPDAAFPDALEQFLARLVGVDLDVDVRRVLWDTPLAFYRLADRFRLQEDRP